MLQELNKRQVEEWHQEIRDWVEDVIKGKYGSFAINMLSTMMHGFKDMKDDLEMYDIKLKADIKRNRKMLGLPPLEEDDEG